MNIFLSLFEYRPILVWYIFLSLFVHCPCLDTERAAYKQHRRRLAKRLNETRSDADWWHTVKLHAGASESRSSAAPSAEKLADYFAEKLSLDGAEDDDVPDFNLEFQIKKTFLLSALLSRM